MKVVAVDRDRASRAGGLEDGAVFGIQTSATLVGAASTHQTRHTKRRRRMESVPPRRQDSRPLASDDHSHGAASCGPSRSDVEAFFLHEPVTEQEVETVAPFIEEAVRRAQERCLRDPFSAQRNKSESDEILEGEEKAEGGIPDTADPDDGLDHHPAAMLEGGGELEPDFDSLVDRPREYQRRLFELAKERNIIVHLGTGMGKTLIAVLLIKHYLQLDPTKRILFLVPSHALVLQQGDVLRANLACRVGTASHRQELFGLGQGADREELCASAVLVSTHGAMKHLLASYGDIFSMDRVSLLVLDECHNCLKNSDYAQIMRDFYHPCPAENRPRVLGLTASPLINYQTPACMAQQLDELEKNMDSIIVSPRALGFDSSLLCKNAEEHRIAYDAWEGLPSDYPAKDTSLLQPARLKDLKQFDEVYKSLGPLALAEYCRLYEGTLERNLFEDESSTQFECALEWLRTLRAFCKRQCQLDATESKGRSNKLLALEKLLREQLKEQPDAVGVVFARMRKMAEALDLYFRRQAPVVLRDTPEPIPPLRDVRILHDDGATVVSSLKDDEPSIDLPRRLGANCPDFVGASDPSGAMSDQKFDGSVESSKVQANQADQCSNRRSTLLVDTNDQFDDAEDDPTSPQVRALDASRSEPYASPFKSLATVAAPCALPSSDPASSQFRDEDEEENVEDGGVGAANVHSPVEAVPESRARPPSLHPHPATRLESFDLSQTTEPAKNLEPIRNIFRAESIRTAALIGGTSDILRRAFKTQLTETEMELMLREMREQEHKVRQVLKNLRCGEINVLIATSVVEEGVDVQACSFVAAFDSIDTIKSFVQMKGRARQHNAKFFVFEHSGARLPLNSLQEKETEILNVLKSRDAMFTPLHLSPPDRVEYALHASEAEAAKQGSFKTTRALVTVQTAKSVLFRFITSQPMDPLSSLFRQSLGSYVPQYHENKNGLTLPAYIGDRCNRDLLLPIELRLMHESEKEKRLAIMAIVRLYKLGLLSDRLQPLSAPDFQQWLLHRSPETAEMDSRGPTDGDSQVPARAAPLCENTDLFVYRLSQSSELLHEFEMVLAGNNTHLALLSPIRLDVGPALVEKHSEFGQVSISLSSPSSFNISSGELKVLTTFFEVLFNARWRRKTGQAKKSLLYAAESYPDCKSIVLFNYSVCCIGADGDLRWDLMNLVIEESCRSKADRSSAIQNFKGSHNEGFLEPRLCCPLYNERTYIVYGPTNIRLSDPFLKDNGLFSTYHDYFKLEKGLELPMTTQLMLAQHVWRLPSRRPLVEISHRVRPSSSPPSTYRVCPGLGCILLPQHACVEKPVANAGLILATTFLPQVLYQLDQRMVALRFIEHLEQHLPKLSSLLKSLCLDEVIQVLSTKSCSEVRNHEILEWLGDAVLKLIHSETLMKFSKHDTLIGNAHEGILNSLRSGMGCNKRLESTCKRLGINYFILNSPLGRATWSPHPLQLHPPCSSVLDGKCCADVIEALLGVSHLYEGYLFSLDVAAELKINIDPDAMSGLGDDGAEIEKLQPGIIGWQPEILELVEEMTRYKFPANHPLLAESLTHPTAFDARTPSYQRLEWFGDAVLCLAAREWIYREFPDENVNTMGAMERVLVSNETLAFLSLYHGIHKFINHNDPTLPGRFLSYEKSIRHRSCGLWGSDPPKAMADVVESILGAVHLHGGLACGQQATQQVLKPVLELILHIRDTGNLRAMDQLLRHPRSLVQQLGGKHMSIRQCPESKFACDSPDTMVWNRLQHYSRAHRSSARSVAHVSCLGVNLVAVADDAPSAATHRACELVLAALDRNPELKKRLHEMRTAASRTPKDEDFEDPDNEGGDGRDEDDILLVS